MNLSRNEWIILGVVGVVLVSGGVFAAVTMFDGPAMSNVEEGGANAVPEQSTFAMYIDVNGLVTAESSRDVGEFAYEEESKTYSQVINKPIDDEEGLNISVTDIDYITGFGTSSSVNNTSPGDFEETFFTETYTGVVVAFEQPLDEQFENTSDIFDNDTEVTETEYNGHTVYELNSSADGQTRQYYIGVLDRNTIVVGKQSVVEDSIDTLEGDNPSVSGQVKDALQTNDTVYVKFAANLSEYENSDTTTRTEYVNDIQFVTGTYETEGSQMNVSVSLELTSESSSTQAESNLNSYIGALQFFITQDNEAAQQELSKMTVERDGTSVTFEYNTSSTSIIEALEGQGTEQQT